MPFPMKQVVKPAWETPWLMEHYSGIFDHGIIGEAPHQKIVDEAAYALSQEHQGDLAEFEDALTGELAAKGMPLVFIQPRAPGHKKARRRAFKFLEKQFGDAPWHPDHKRDF